MTTYTFTHNAAHRLRGRHMIVIHHTREDRQMTPTMHQQHRYGDPVPRRRRHSRIGSLWLVASGAVWLAWYLVDAVILRFVAEVPDDADID